MASKAERLTTSEFASLSGIPISKVSRLIREGRIRATKQTGKWMILKSQLTSKAVQEFSSQSKKKPLKKKVTEARTSPPVKKKTISSAKKSGSAAKNMKPAVNKKKAAVKKNVSNKKTVRVKETAIKIEKPLVSKKKISISKNESKSTDKTYSIEDFSKMTCLTEYGVIDWLKKGWLVGKQNNTGDWRVSASSLELTRMRKLIR